MKEAEFVLFCKNDGRHASDGKLGIAILCAGTAGCLWITDKEGTLS